MVDRLNVQEVSDEDRRDFLKFLGVTGSVALGGTAASGVTLSDLRDATTAESSGELAEMGSAVAGSLSADLDPALLNTEMGGVATAIDGLPDVRAEGFPALGESLYGGLTTAAWRIDQHLSEAGFYASAEANLPAYTAEHIEAATKQLIHTESFAGILSAIGFTESEQTALLANVVDHLDDLALWQPAWALEAAEVEEIYPEYVPPLHRRAAAGSLIWVDGLDKYQYQNEVLITEEMMDAAARDVRAMLGGFHLMGTAAKRLGEGEIADEALTALVTGSSAIMIAGQTDLQNDIVRVSDEMRAPPRMRGEL